MRRIKKDLKKKKLERYNPDNLFKNNKKVIEKQVALVEVKKTGFINKCLNIIKNWLKRK